MSTSSPSLQASVSGLLVSFVVAAGCASPSPMPPGPGRLRFEQTSVGAFVGEMRESQGGVERWRRFAGARFAYRVDWPGGGRSFARVGFRFDDFEHLWIEEIAGGEVRIAATGRGRSPLAALASVRRDPADEPGLLALDFALRAVHFFFAPALVTAHGRWDYQELMAPSPLAMPTRIEVVPIEASPPAGPYLLERDERTGRLARILYRGVHPLVRGATQEVVFRSYSPVDGLAIALVREHRRPRRAGGDAEIAADPFHLEPPPPPFVVVLSERIDRVELISRSEVDAVMPIPEDDEGDREPEQEVGYGYGR